MVHVEHGELVSPCIGSIISIIGEVQTVVAVGLEVGGAVEQVILRIGCLGLHLALAQRTIDAEG